MNRPNGLPYYVLLLIKTDAEITLNGKTHHCKPDSVLFIRPDTPYSYKNPNGEYVDDWLHFSCDPEDKLLLSEQMFSQSFPINNARLLTTYIQQLLWENTFTPEKEKDFYVDSLFRLLLQHIIKDFYDDTVAEYNTVGCCNIYTSDVVLTAADSNGIIQYLVTGKRCGQFLGVKACLTHVNTDCGDLAVACVNSHREYFAGNRLDIQYFLNNNAVVIEILCNAADCVTGHSAFRSVTVEYTHLCICNIYQIA